MTFKQNKRFEILTPSGFQHFDGINKVEHQQGVRITLQNGKFLTCSLNHPLVQYPGNIILSKQVTLKTKLQYENKYVRVCKIELINGNNYYYDPINVSEGHLYISDGFVSHNCEFLSSDALLISSIVLNNIKVSDVMPEPDFMGVHWFEQINEKQTILIGIDPSTGTGNDLSSIEIFNFPDLRQIGEFRSNTTSSVDLYKTLKGIIKFLERKKSSIYFSIENNGVGEGIISLYQNDENPPEAYFVSEAGRNRLGMTTTGKSKMKACINLKELITKGKMKIASKMLLSELKGYVRKMGSYTAQVGSTDDSISATLIVVRLLEEMSSYEDKAFEMLYHLDDGGMEKNDEYDEYDEGTAMIFASESNWDSYLSKGTFTNPNDPNSFDPFGEM